MATLQDIADRCGVSTVTVSNVLNGKIKGSWPSSAARAQRVREVAHELGYRVDWRAKALKTKRTYMVGLLTTDKPETQVIEGQVLAGLIEAFGEANYQLVFVRVHKDAPNADFADARFDGIVIDYHLEAEELEVIRRAELPAVVINAPAPSDNVLSVMPDHLEAGALAARHLLDLGHRRIGFVDSSESEQAHWPRHMIGQWRAGLRREMRHAGCADGLVEIEPRNGTKPETPETYRPLLASLYAGPDRPTALIANNGMRAARVALRLSASLGLRCPGDLSVVSMVDEPAMDWTAPPITSVALPFRDLGREAARQLVGRIESADPEPRRPRAELVVRDSTAPPA
ncbi:MAG: LacI family DNA-binding transcriptional regulator [Planctomycetota bacterium]